MKYLCEIFYKEIYSALPNPQKYIEWNGEINKQKLEIHIERGFLVWTVKWGHSKPYANTNEFPIPLCLNWCEALVVSWYWISTRIFWVLEERICLLYVADIVCGGVLNCRFLSLFGECFFSETIKKAHISLIKAICAAYNMHDDQINLAELGELVSINANKRYCQCLTRLAQCIFGVSGRIKYTINAVCFCMSPYPSQFPYPHRSSYPSRNFLIDRMQIQTWAKKDFKKQMLITKSSSTDE